MILSHACLPIPTHPRYRALRIISQTGLIVNKSGIIFFHVYRLQHVRRSIQAAAHKKHHDFIHVDWRFILSRVINTQSVGKERTQLTRSIVLALRELMRQAEADEHTRDLAAYIALALEEIYKTIDVSVSAWEKRGYWVKADRFRMDWIWSESLGRNMHQAVLAEDWPAVAATSAQVAEKLRDVDVPKRHQLGTPWVGAWKKMQALDQS